MKRWLVILSLTLTLQTNAHSTPINAAHINVTPEVNALLAKPKTIMWININGQNSERHILEPLTFPLSNSLLFRSILTTPTNVIINNKTVMTEIQTGWEIMVKEMTDTEISIDINVMEKSLADKTKVQTHTKTLHFTDLSAQKSCQVSSFTGKKIKSIQLCLKSILTP